MIDLASEAWRRALTIGLRVRLADDRGGALPLPVFRFGPVDVAYAGFPVGLTPGEAPQALEAARASGAALVRIITTGGPLADGSGKRRYVQTSAWIPDLRAWSPGATDKARRTRNRKARSPVVLRDSHAGDGDALWRLYRQTLTRRGGSARYTSTYFAELADAGVLVATLDEAIIGFAACGVFGSRAFYLHGAHDPVARPHYPSDLLFLAMLERAKARGAESFDFLPSPPQQPALHAYKRSWGAFDTASVTEDVPISMAGSALAAAYAARQRLSRWRSSRA